MKINDIKLLEAKLSSIILLFLFFMHIVVIIVSWLFNAAGGEVRNLLAASGIRWFFLHITDCFMDGYIIYLIITFSAWGALQRSGLMSAVLGLFVSETTYRKTYRERMALIITIVVGLFIFSALLLTVVLPEGILLSTVGRIQKSPFMEGIFPVSVVCLQILSLIYASTSNHLGTLDELVSSLYWGIKQNAVWIVVYLLFSQLLASVTYAFPDLFVFIDFLK